MKAKCEHFHKNTHIRPLDPCGLLHPSFFGFLMLFFFLSNKHTLSIKADSVVLPGGQSLNTTVTEDKRCSAETSCSLSTPRTIHTCKWCHLCIHPFIHSWGYKQVCALFLSSAMIDILIQLYKYGKYTRRNCSLCIFMYIRGMLCKEEQQVESWNTEMMSLVFANFENAPKCFLGYHAV